MSKLLQERLLAQREALDAAVAALRAAGAGAAASAPAGQQEALDASLPDQAPPVIPHALPSDHRAMEARLALESEAVLRRERDSLLESEAVLRRERDSLLDWKVGLELGLPELGGPAQVVRGFRGLQEKVLVLEGEVCALRERQQTLCAKGMAATEAQQVLERKSASLDARVLELEQQLALARADIEREQRATAAEKEMVASFKAEEILLRDAKVLELQQELQTTKAHILKSLLYSDFTDF